MQRHGENQEINWSANTTGEESNRGSKACPPLPRLTSRLLVSSPSVHNGDMVFRISEIFHNANIQLPKQP